MSSAGPVAAGCAADMQGDAAAAYDALAAKLRAAPVHDRHAGWPARDLGP